MNEEKMIQNAAEIGAEMQTRSEAEIEAEKRIRNASETEAEKQVQSASEMESEKQARKAAEKPRLPYSVLGVASAVYALFYTFCLYKNVSGITYPFFAAGTLCYLFFCMRKCRVPSDSTAQGEEEGPKNTELNRDGAALFYRSGREKLEIGFYGVCILLLGISVCLTDDWKLWWMTKTGIFLLTVSLALRCFYRTGGWTFFKYLSAVGRSILEMLHYFDTPFSDAVMYWREKDKSSKNKNLRYFLLGLVVAVPLLAVILALLLSADAVFFDLFERRLGGFDWLTLLLICLMVLAAYVISYSFVRGLITYRMPEMTQKEKKGEPVAAITFTSLTAVIYLVFCIIQVVYLFLGNMQLPEGLTWASYARQGFFQLLFVCLINLVMVLVCLAFFKESRILKGILTLISLMTYILIASSAYRMILYIMNYYMTFLRLFVLWSLAVIGIIFAGIIISIYKKSFPLFGYCTVVVTVCYIGFAFSRPDYQVAKYDLAHMAVSANEDGGADRKAGFEDYWYLTDLSLDAAPLLAQESVREMWENTGAGQYYYDRVWKRTEDMGLRDFNFSRWNAKKSLEGWYQKK